MSSRSSLLDVWRGPFGDEYTDRQPHVDTLPALYAILDGLLPRISTILEVGCNRGDNIYRAFPGKTVCAIEPNHHARKQAKDRGLFVLDATAHNLPFVNAYFDLVFTAGVLIHITPAVFDQTLKEIHRVAKKWILAIEYAADHPTPVDYRGVRHGIWKRDFGYEYERRNLATVKQHGVCDRAFPGCDWWLLEKLPLVR